MFARDTCCGTIRTARTMIPKCGNTGRSVRTRVTRKLLLAEGWHGRPAKEGRGGGGFQKWASIPGPLFCVKTDVAAKGTGTPNFDPEKLFSPNIFPPHMCSQNDQRGVRIILSHICWGRPPPPPAAQQVGQPRPKSPSRHDDQGGGGVGQMGFRAIHPPKAIFFPSRGC